MFHLPRLVRSFWPVFGLLGYLSVAHASADFQVQIGDDQSISFTAAAGSKQAAPKPVKPGLFDLTYIGALLPGVNDSMPYFLFAGNPCKTCSAERALYLIRPSTTSSAPKITSFVQPGKIVDPKSGTLVLDSHAYYGHCLATQKSDSDDVFVVFQKERVDRRHSLQLSVFIAEASADFLRERLLERGMPSVNRTLTLVHAKKCREIEGRSRHMVLKPHGLNWRNLQPTEEDDEDKDKDAEGEDASKD